LAKKDRDYLVAMKKLLLREARRLEDKEIESGLLFDAAELMDDWLRRNL
jgi:hypothetical protein